MRTVLLSLVFVSSALSAYVPGTPGAAWTKDEVVAIKAKLWLSFARPWGLTKQANTALGTTDPGDNGGDYNAAKVLRLTFHDCLKYDDGTGGCDGCLNWTGMGTRFDDAPNQKKYADVGLTDNNGLRHTVEILEAMYQIKSFPNGAPTLKASLKESGKSRADLWALAGIVAVEYGIETNNMKCRDSSSTSGCHHLQGKPGCSIALNSTIPFRTGRTDCIPTDSARPYIAAKHEVHPNSVGDGQELVTFFQQQFGFTGQETVAIMGAHTFGRLHIHTSLFRYVWTSRGTNFFNNDYYKMITDDTRWFFDDDACTKVGDAYNNKPVRRWTTHYRGDTKNNGPVHWISESYVCPNCARSQNSNDKCCQNIPQGKFCVPDSKNRTQKTPNQLNHGCESYRFISGIDEMALPCEMGLYFEFQNRGNGFPTGCPGFENFRSTGTTYGQSWSNINGIKADPQCNLQSLSLPASDNSTSWYMREYAVDQDRFIRDFVAVFDKMLSNGSPALQTGPDQSSGVICTSQSKARNWGIMTQCWEEGILDDHTQYVIISRLDGRAVQLNRTTGEAQMMIRDDSSNWQKWRLKVNADGVSRQFVNVGNNQSLSVRGISDFTHNTPDGQGYFNIIATRGLEYSPGKPAAWDRGWGQKNGDNVGVWNQHNGANQKFKLEALNVPI